MAVNTLPILSPDAGLDQYMREIQQFPMLEAQEEQELAKKWHEEEDIEAAHRMVTSHLRLVVKIALGFRGYGLPLMEMISEGNIGLMQAVKKFDYKKGFRLSTYAMWWIRASIQEYILRSWSLVKIGTTAAQKKLFFNLRRLKGRLNLIEDTTIPPQELREIANELAVSEGEVLDMDMRLTQGDASLNETIRIGNESDGKERIELLEAQESSQELLLEHHEEQDIRQQLLKQALMTLNDRERDIFYRRRLLEDPDTLEVLSQEYGISRERIRQIENRVMEKISQFITDQMEHTTC